MTEKKKLIRVEPYNNATKSVYKMNNFHFGFITGPEHNRKQITQLVTCREYLNRSVWASFNRNKINIADYGVGEYPIDFGTMRLLIVHDPSDVKSFKERLFNGKAVLNLLEELAGWNKSTITTVKHPIYDNAWLITGPSGWMSTPQLLSIATWVLRLSADYGPIDTNSFDEYEADLFRLYKSTPDDGNTKRGFSDATTYNKKIWDKIYILMKYHSEIFKGIDLSKAWYCNDEDISMFTVRSGFLSFSEEELSLYSKEAENSRKNFFKLCSKILPRKNKFIKNK
jgi:hypothetical protein